ncbi:Uncharacterised protein [Pragia fontium]|uniref:hypothetical protein n=1 Tax=Pragia fontium TaxID=82985 RepID=UPI000E07616E|nr:hypothetical protein [Pragia fontium]SUB84222.1 Uncharacterised protein [Pragia fontium]
MLNSFQDNLIKHGWVVERFNKRKKIDLLPEVQQSRIANIPDSLMDIILSYDAFTNDSDTAWFVTYSSLVNKDEDAFTWNEYELQSIDAAMSQKNIDNTKDFWSKHFCFMMSVKGGYSHISIVTSGDDIGKIFWGEEPEYEEVSFLANNFEEFSIMLSEHVAGIKNNAILAKMV